MGVVLGQDGDQQAAGGGDAVPGGAEPGQGRLGGIVAAGEYVRAHSVILDATYTLLRAYSQVLSKLGADEQCPRGKVALMAEPMSAHGADPRRAEPVGVDAGGRDGGVHRGPARGGLADAGGRGRRPLPDRLPRCSGSGPASWPTPWACGTPSTPTTSRPSTTPPASWSSEGKRPLSVGFFFSLGHSSVVFVLAILLNFGIRALDSEVKNDNSGLHNVTGIVGTTVSGTFLYIIAAAEHDHPGRPSSGVPGDAHRPVRRRRTGGASSTSAG